MGVMARRKTVSGLEGLLQVRHVIRAVMGNRLERDTASWKARER